MDWEGGSVYKVPITPARGLEFRSLKKGIMVCISNALAGETETGGSTEHPASRTA